MMTNHERYRAAFGHIHAPAGAARKALDSLERRPARPRRRSLRLAAVLAVIAVLLVGSASAEIASGEISNLLAPLYGGAQTELVDRIGAPVGASVTVNGYTLTADAVIGDRYHILVVYTLTRDDGEPIPEGACFREWENNFDTLAPFFTSGGRSGSTIREGLPPNQLCIVESSNTSAPLLRHDYSVTFQDLALPGEEEYTYDILAEGTWELHFTLRYRDCTVVVPLNDATFTNQDGRTCTLQELQISPIGLYVKLTRPTPEWGTPGLGDDIQVSLRLSDGSVMEVRCGGGGGWTKGDETYKGLLSADFSTPIPLEDIEAIVFNDTEIPLDLS